MNRLVFILLVAFGWVCSAVSAEEYAAKVFDSNYFNVIPGFLSSDGKACVYTADWIDDEDSYYYHTVHCTLFDDDFNMVKEFNVDMPIYSDKIYTQYCEEVDGDIIPGKISEGEAWDYFDGMSLEEVLDELRDVDIYNSTILRLEDGTEVIALSFWEEKRFGKTYPSRFLLQKNGHWYECEREYTSEISYKWGEIKEETNYYPVDLLEVNYMQEDGTGGQGKFFRNRFSCLTRGIFGDFITYIKPTCEDVPFETISDTRKQWGTTSLGNGFEVYDLNNRLITSIKLPSGLYLYNNIDFLNLSGKKYIVVLATTKEGLLIDGTHNGDESIVIYSLDKETKATQIAIAPVGKVSPRDPRKGENVTVTVDGKYANEECMVNVVSTEGRSMLRRAIAPGESSITFNTDSFPQGVYIVTFSGKSGKSEAAKIIVR